MLLQVMFIQVSTYSNIMIDMVLFLSISQVLRTRMPVEVLQTTA